MKKHIFLSLLLILGLTHLSTATNVELVLSLCGKQEASMLSKITPSQANHDNYRATFYDATNNYVDEIEFTYATRPSFLDFAQTKTDLEYEEIYTVKFEVRANGSTTWSAQSTGCTIRFVNAVQLTGNYCPKYDMNMTATIWPNYQQFHSYKAIFYDHGTSNVHEDITYDAPNWKTFLQFAQDEADLEYGVTYDVRFEVKNTANSVWSPEGAICEIAFENKVELHGNFCGETDLKTCTKLYTNYSQFYEYRAILYDAAGINPQFTYTYIPPTLPQFRDYAGIQANTQYQIRFEVKNISSSTWSGVGDPCLVGFPLEVDLGGTLACNNPVNLGANLTVTGEAPPYSYNWSGPNGFTSILENPQVTVSGSLPVYTVTVTDNCGLTMTDDVTVECINIIYVDANGTGMNDGASWANAYNLLEDGLLDAENNPGYDEVWVATSTYSPPNVSGFRMPDDVRVIGGFSGVENNENDRNWALNPTTISGWAGANSNYTGQSTRVVNMGETTTSGLVTIDGFIIEGGLANIQNENEKNANGGGIFVSFRELDLKNCIVRNNEAKFNGGGIFIKNSSVNIDNCLFTGNSTPQSAFGQGGGAICVQALRTADDVVINSSTIADNVSASYGGAIWGEMANGTISLYNSIVYDNSQSGVNEIAATFSIASTFDNVEDLIYDGNNLTGTNIINADPLFVGGGSYTLSNGSPAIDEGDIGNVIFPLSLDLAHTARIVGLEIDLGPYEFGTATNTTIHYVDQNVAIGTHDGTEWSKAFLTVQAALEVAQYGEEIWVAEGVYIPTHFDGTDVDALASPSINEYGRFELIDGVKMYGGFEGDENFIAQRNWRENLTILSGDREIVGDHTDNCNNVIKANGVDANSRLDGFIIEDADGEHSNAHYTGGAGMIIYDADIVVENCVFRNNHTFRTGEKMLGGGIQILHFSDPTIINCLFENNSATEGGGVGICRNSNPILINCLIVNNEAELGGGMVAWDNSAPQFMNCTFYGNEATGTHGGGAGLSLFNAHPTITNSIINGNIASVGDDFVTFSGTYYSSADISIPNMSTAMASTTTVNESITQTWSTGTGLAVGDNPQFDNVSDIDGVDNIFGTADDGFVASGTAVLAEGLTSEYTGTGVIANSDLKGDSRFIGIEIDLGPYEWTGSGSKRGPKENDVQETLNELSGISIFPNPTRERLTIMADEPIVAVNLFDLKGQQLRGYHFTGQQSQLDLELTNAASGTYLLQVITVSNVSTERIVIQH